MTKLGTISTCLPETGWRRRWSWPQWAVDFVAIAPQAHRQRHQQAEPEAQPCVELECWEVPRRGGWWCQGCCKDDRLRAHLGLHLLCESQAPKQTPSPKRPHRLQVAHPAKTFLWCLLLRAVALSPLVVAVAPFATLIAAYAPRLRNQTWRSSLLMLTQL